MKKVNLAEQITSPSNLVKHLKTKYNKQLTKNRLEIEVLLGGSTYVANIFRVNSGVGEYYHKQVVSSSLAYLLHDIEEILNNINK